MTTERWYTYSGATGLEVGAHNSPDGGDLVCSPPPRFASASLAHWPRRSRLIAAAPDLYEALELVLKWHNETYPFKTDWHKDVLPAIEDALAKARPAEDPGLNKYDANAFATPDPKATLANDVPEPAKKTKKRKTLTSVHARLIKAMDDYTALVGDQGYATAILSEDDWELLANVSRFDDTPPHILRVFEKALQYARGRNPNNKKLALKA